MADKALSYLFGSATQGSADAYVQSSMTTGLYNVTGWAYQIHEIMIEWSGSQGVTGVSAAYMEVALTRKSLSAMPLITDKSVIWKWKRTNALVTSGMQTLPTLIRETYTEDDNLLIVEDPIYIQLDTAATTATNIIYVRIGYRQVKISDVDRLTLISNSLA